MTFEEIRAELLLREEKIYLLSNSVKQLLVSGQKIADVISPTDNPFISAIDLDTFYNLQSAIYDDHKINILNVLNDLP